MKKGHGTSYVKTETARNITAIKWYDNKFVHLVPISIKEYNASMGGVDIN